MAPSTPCACGHTAHYHTPWPGGERGGCMATVDGPVQLVTLLVESYTLCGCSGFTVAQSDLFAAVTP